MNPIVTSMLFFPEKQFYEKPEDYGLEYEEIRFASGRGVELFGWFLPARSSRGTLLFFHGNAGNISGRLSKAKGWLDRGFSVFLVDYRGYGKSTGSIKRGPDLLEDARAALGWLHETRKVPLPEIILYGESIGSHPAIFLGTEHPVMAVVLEAPFTSLAELTRVHYPFVPALILGDFVYPNEELIGKLRAPLFILHGERDEICPYAMAGELFEKAPEPKGFLSVPGGMHNDLPMTAGEDFWGKPAEFILKNARA